jgi:hypothetical protein
MAKYKTSRPMRIQARSGSIAEGKYYAKSSLPGTTWLMPGALAPGVNPAPLEDLIFHGGKVVPQMEFQNVYLGGTSSWSIEDITSIDFSILRAMQHKRLNNVMAQYFPGNALSCDARDSFILDDIKPAQLNEPDVQELVVSLFDSNLIAKSDLETCIFNLVLPAGSVLKLDDLSSMDGLGGYHGSTHIMRAGKKITLYYSANVFSETTSAGKENGIVAFDKPWKNVVATLYHELNEFRTDADVNDAIQKNNNDFLGWSSRSGREVGDQPIFAAANDLRVVFKQIVDAAGSGRLPIQLMYSNAVHGAEGPIAKPHA